MLSPLGKSISLMLFLLGLMGCSEKNKVAVHTSLVQSSVASATIEGVDLSQWQGAVDFPKIKNAGKTYVFIKATLGDTVFDPNYTTNIQQARAAGLVLGSYHFYMTDDTPQAQFDNFSSHVTVNVGDLPPVIDIETLSNNTLPNLAQDLTTFIQMIEQHYGVKPILYSGESFANQYLTQFGEYPLWLAEYNKDKSPVMPAGWTHWTFWQHTQNGHVDGVEGNVDLDRFNGSLDQFTLLLKR